MADVKITDLSAVTALNGTDSFIVEQSSAGTKRTTYENLKTKIVNGDTYTALNGENILTAINNKVPLSSGYSHNSIARGKDLGTSVTSAQWAAIKNGTFEDLYIGDYWTINGRQYFIAAFNYYFRAGDANHVVIVPRAAMSENVAMNDTASNATGYRNSTMHTTTMATTVRSTIQNDFGAAHIWSHQFSLSSQVTNGVITGTGASPASDIVLMTKGNVFGNPTPINASALNDSDQDQFPLFAYAQVQKRIQGFSYWLRDPVSTDSYMLVEIGSGVIKNAVANTESAAIRPCFCIYSA